MAARLPPFIDTMWEYFEQEVPEVWLKIQSTLHGDEKQIFNPWSLIVGIGKSIIGIMLFLAMLAFPILLVSSASRLIDKVFWGRQGQGDNESDDRNERSISITTRLSAQAKAGKEITSIGSSEAFPITEAVGVRRASWAKVLNSEGLILITVHGTGDNDAVDAGAAGVSRWWQKGSAFHQALSLPSTVWLPFHWHGGNSDIRREQAARGLARLLGALSDRKRKYMLLGHSHGGNVIDYALGRYGASAGSLNLCQAVLTYGTPFFESAPKPSWYFSLVGRLVIWLLLLMLAAYFATISLLEGINIYRYVNEFGYSAFWRAAGLNALKFPLYPWAFLASASSAAYFGQSGFRLLQSLVARQQWKNKLQKRWKNIVFARDEVLGFLPKFNIKSMRFLTSSRTSESLNRSFLILSRVILIIAGGYTGFEVWQMCAQAFNHFSDVQTLSLHDHVLNAFLRQIYGLAFLGKAALLIAATFLLPWVVATGLPIVLGMLVSAPISMMGNNLVRNIMRASAYGDDGEHHLRGVRTTPRLLEAEAIVLDKRYAGRIGETAISTVTETLYDHVIGFQSADELCSNPDSFMSGLMRALYHNAYFDDEDVASITLSHLNTAMGSDKI